MRKIIDISVSLCEVMPVYPGNAGFKMSLVEAIAKGDAANVGAINTGVHNGTHVDAPWHFISDGPTVDKLDPEKLIGAAYVGYLPDLSMVTAQELTALNLPAGTTRLLLRTANSNLWAEGILEFQKDYVALTADAAQWVVDRGIQLIGVDYLSVQRFGDSPTTHQILLGAGIVVVEGLNLSGVQPGAYELICLPLKIAGADGAPARAVLRTL